MEHGAYGASLAGGTFDLESFVKKPQTILRFLSWVSDSWEKLAPASLHICWFAVTYVRILGSN